MMGTLFPCQSRPLGDPRDIRDNRPATAGGPAVCAKLAERKNSTEKPGAAKRFMTITDCHIHIQPYEMFKSGPIELMKKARGGFDDILEYSSSPKSLLKYLDSVGVERAVLINYVAPDVMGLTAEVNQWVVNYCKENPRRLLSCGSVHPRHTLNALADMQQIVSMGIRMIKIHPPHQLMFANDYLNGVKELEIIYRMAENNGVPVMVH